MRMYNVRYLVLALVAAALTVGSAAAQVKPDPRILELEKARVEAVQRVHPAVVAIFAKGGKGGGSGVVISEDGYALTNFHVVQPAGPLMQCGLADGVLYDAVLVGLDKVGDVALIKLLPKKEGDKFKYAPLGDSDLVKAGDWSLAMGNPFLLATDFTPTVTFGLVSGTNRYQYPSGILLEYTDCIQIDTSINPGNSGGPLFNLKGELIGINGRGSFDKRGRINSGVGYAISINQIKNFMGHLRAGIDTDHATLGATVATQTDKVGLGRMEVNNMLEESDVARRGLQIGDELVSFDGRLLTSANHFRNVLGIFPRGWRVPLEYRREQTMKKEILVRLMGIQRRVLSDPNPQPPPGPKPIPAPKVDSPAAKYYEPKPGFANYYFNKVEQNRLLDAFRKHGDFSKLTGAWGFTGSIRLKQLKSESPVRVEIKEEKQGASFRSVVQFKVDAFPYVLEPLKPGQDEKELRQPLGSGGLLAALYVYQRLLTQGKKGFEKFDHGGYEPVYPPPPDGKMAARLKDLRQDAEVLNTEHGPFKAKWFFSQKDQQLVGFELWQAENEDPCEVYFSDYRAVNGRMLPHRLQVIHGDSHYGTITVKNWELN